ncbi:MAG: hypothetical protein IKL84_07890, partial [Clostridia bacterium]|nr:hypothetical protein [Clostridia bacterium]
MRDNWIWLPKSSYPDNQTTHFDALSRVPPTTYTVAEFQKKYEFDREIASVNLRFSADTDVQLYCNGEILATGPATVGGDFLGNGRPRQWYYATEMEYAPKSNCLDFFARVKMTPILICEFSRGHGGFTLTAEVQFADGTTTTVGTDESWQVRRNGAYAEPLKYDGRIAPDPYVAAEVTPDIWQAETAPIPPRTEKELFPAEGEIQLQPGEAKEVCIPLDMVYAGFVHMRASTDGEITAHMKFREIDEEHKRNETVILADGSDYRGFCLHSAGNILAQLENHADTPSTVKISFITTCYPVTETAQIETSDSELNRVLDVCRHTLKYCRQTHHLDSPRHCEPLACTGDYYIESLMTAFSFGDQRLSAFDVLRTAELLRHNDGRMFHTTYSLIWVRMLYDVYMMTGDRTLIEKCRDALDLLLARFTRYLGENGLVETPPDYMFVDWIYIDEISLHHPPKCLGQTVLNMFYFNGLVYAAKIYGELGDETAKARCLADSEALRTAINTHLYDAERGLYFEGLNTPSPEESLKYYLPQNPDRRYYLKQSNILAVYTSVCDDETAAQLVDKIMSGECPGDYQPYFAHYLLEGIFTHGLTEKYTRTVLE